MNNLSDVADKFQKDNSIKSEDLLGAAATLAFALVDKNGNIVVNGSDLAKTLSNILAKQTGDGIGAIKVARATFDPSAKTAHRTIAAHTLGVTIPDKSIIIGAFYDVVTTFASATDAGTVAFHVNAADDILAAIAISDASNVLDAGRHGGKPGYPNLGADAAHDSQVEVAALFAATTIKTTAARLITATVAVEALTAGKAVLFIFYVPGS